MMLRTILVLAVSSITGSAYAQGGIVYPPGMGGWKICTTTPTLGQAMVFDGTQWCPASPAQAGIPAGLIAMSLTSCPSGFSEVSALNGKLLRGTLAANGDAGTTGGNATITPTGTINAQTFAGTANQATSLVSAGTPAGTNSTALLTPLGTISWPVAVPTFTGAAFTSVINHIHPVSVTDPGHNHTQNAHTHTLQMQGGTTAAITGVHIMNSTAVGGSSRAATAPDQANSTTATNNSTTTGITATTSNPAGGVASITPAGTVAWPAGVPVLVGTQGTVPAEVFTGTVLPTHAHTLTPAGTISQATFTGSAIDPSPSYLKVIFCSKN